MLLYIILSDFQQYRTLLAKVIQFFVFPEKCENQRYEFLTPDRRYDTIVYVCNKSYYPPTKSEGYSFGCVRPSIPSVRPSVRPEPYLSTYWSDLIHSWYK